MEGKKINFQKAELDNVIAKLQSYYNELLSIEKKIRLSDEEVVNSLVEKTREAYQERSQKVLHLFGNSLVHYSALIRQMEQAKSAALRTDTEAGKRMM